MSNTSTVTPYRSGAEAGGEVAGIAAGTACMMAIAGAAIAVGAAAAAIRWLREETPEDREAVELLAAARRRERLQVGPRGEEAAFPAPKAPLATLPLHTREAWTLLQTAESLGYRRERLDMTEGRRDDLILLRGGKGERIVVEQTECGVSLHTAARPERLRDLVRHHTIERTIDHLRAGGFTDIRRTAAGGGEMEIRAQEGAGSRADGAAALTVHVGADGTASVDIEGVRGRRCEAIVTKLADAVGGRARAVTKKTAFFQLPGEPARVRLKG